MKFDDKYDSARPYTACFVLLIRDNKVAMIERQNTGWMDGYYGLPAGKLEYHETFSAGAAREALEEVGVKVDPTNLDFVHVAHRHGEGDGLFMDWVDIYFAAKSWEGEPHNAESEKASAFAWISLAELPENIVPPQRAALQAILKSEPYSEFGW